MTHLIACADARALPLPDESVDLVVTSPPYFGVRDYKSAAEIGREDTVAAYLDALVDVLKECERTLTPTGSMFVVIGDKYVSDNRGSGGDAKREHKHAPVGPAGFLGREVGRKGALLMLPYRLAIAAGDRGLFLRQEIVWRKPNPVPDPAIDRCVRTRETILHFVKNRRYFTANTARGGLGSDVWEVPVQGYRDTAGTRHPAVYPEALVERAVAGWTAPGHVVMDPFNGSGTTTSVAVRMGRRAYGFDANAAFAQVARRRTDATAERAKVERAQREADAAAS